MCVFDSRSHAPLRLSTAASSAAATTLSAASFALPFPPPPFPPPPLPPPPRPLPLAWRTDRICFGYLHAAADRDAVGRPTRPVAAIGLPHKLGRLLAHRVAARLCERGRRVVLSALLLPQRHQLLVRPLLLLLRLEAEALALSSTLVLLRETIQSRRAVHFDAQRHLVEGTVLQLLLRGCCCGRLPLVWRRRSAVHAVSRRGKK